MDSVAGWEFSSPHGATNDLAKVNMLVRPGQKEAAVPDAKFGSLPPGEDRRSKPRIYVPFHATVRGLNNEGDEFDVETVVDNMSSDGLYLRMMPRVKEGARLTIALKLDTAPDLTQPDLTQEAQPVLVDGVVLRSENKAGGVCGVAVVFDKVRFA
jgi:hypothetical protein